MGVIGTVFTFADVRLTGSGGTSSGADSLKFYTVLSNIVATFISGAACVRDYLFLKGKKGQFTKKFFALKLAGTTGVALTFLIVIVYLAPFNADGFFSMFYNSNLFFHLLIPILSIIVFVFFENRSDIDFHYTFVSVIPTLVYGLFYAVNAALHTSEGKIIPEYDWYRFFYGGVWTAITIYFVILCLTYSISFLLWKFNRKLSKNKKQQSED